MSLQESASILCCPATKQKLCVADDELLAALNARIEKGSLKTTAGSSVEVPLEAGLVREDGTILYPVEDGLPVMLIDRAVVIAE